MNKKTQWNHKIRTPDLVDVDVVMWSPKAIEQQS